MVDIAERIRDEEATGQLKNAAQWIELFAHYFVTQRHIIVKTRGVTARAVLMCVVRLLGSSRSG